MKILIVTDSHQEFENLLKTYKREKPDIVICAGDHSTDVEELSFVHKEAKYYIVRGNCDFYDMKHEDVLDFELNGIKIFLTHGHLYGVKSSYTLLKKEAKKREANLVIFGHTHIPHLEEDEKITLYNPGAMKDGKYGIIEIQNREIKIETKSI